MSANDTARQAVIDKLFEQGEDLMRQLPPSERQVSLRPIWENYRQLVFREWLAHGVDCQRAAALALHEAYLNQHVGNLTGDKRLWAFKQALQYIPDGLR